MKIIGGEEAGFSDSSEHLSAGSSKAVGATPCGCPDLDLHSYLKPVVSKEVSSQVVLVVKNPPAIAETQETWVGSLDQEDPLEKEMVTHSSIIAWRIPWMEKPSRLQSMGLQRVRHD